MKHMKINCFLCFLLTIILCFGACSPQRSDNNDAVSSQAKEERVYIPIEEDDQYELYRAKHENEIASSHLMDSSTLSLNIERKKMAILQPSAKSPVSVSLQR